MNSWIFQTNPNHYDIDGLLASSIREVLFVASQGAKKMSPGDTVYIWRSQGKNKAESGIVAKARLVDSPSDRVDDGADSKFWKDTSKASIQSMRVKLRIEEVANKKEVIQRKWLLGDPVLKSLNILTMANKSNYQIQGKQLDRINSLWDNTGVKWTRPEIVAALCVYHLTYGGKLSRLPGSPIAKTATLIGRAVGSVYNKVLNFRHIDTRDVRAGFSGASDTDKEVWADFFDVATNEIDADALDQEFLKFWQSGTPVISAGKNLDNALYASDEAGTYRPGPVPKAGEYTATVTQADAYFVYILELSNKKAVKIGMSRDPKSRLSDYNHKIVTEISGLNWRLAFMQKFKTAEKAQVVEQAVIKKFIKHQLPSNGEVLRDLDIMSVQLEVIRASNEVS